MSLYITCNYKLFFFTNLSKLETVMWRCCIAIISQPLVYFSLNLPTNFEKITCKMLLQRWKQKFSNGVQSMFIFFTKETNSLFWWNVKNGQILEIRFWKQLSLYRFWYWVFLQILNDPNVLTGLQSWWL